jgi:hypothetical protein
LLIEQVSLDGIADVVTRHDIAVHVLLTLCTIKSMDVNLANELKANWTFFRCIVLIDANNDISKGPGLKNRKKINL